MPFLLQPLFLYLPYQAAHPPMKVPDIYLDSHPHINDTARRLFAGKYFTHFIYIILNYCYIGT